MFKVVLRKRVLSGFHAGSSTDVILARGFVLPFAPFIGLNILEGDFDTTIQEISYYPKEEYFVCWTEDCKELYYANRPGEKRTPERSLEQIVAEYIEQGWTRSTPEDILRGL